MAAETLIRGQVHTNDPPRPRAGAVLVRGDRVAAVGDFDDLRALSPSANILDAGTGAVLPGLVDGHAHPSMLGRALATARLDGARSMEDVVATACAWAHEHPHGWVLGHGWDDSRWAGGLALDASAIDMAFPYRPALLLRVDGHAALANRAARETAGLLDGAADPPGGRIIRDVRGLPTGLVVDAAMELVAAQVPSPTAAERATYLTTALEYASSLGLTGVHDAGIDPETDATYRHLAQAQRLPLRVFAMADLSRPGGLDLVRSGVRPESDRYELRAVKLFADGALGSRGAQLFEPYADEPSHSGLAVQSDDQMWRLGSEAARRGFQLCIHAIGDRANARVLDLYERIQAEGVPLDRPRLEHAQILRASDVARIRALGVVCSMQPIHAVTDAAFAEQRLGSSRLVHAYACRALARAGVPVAFGSDFPVASPDPRLGLDAATHGGGWRSNDGLTIDEAVDGYTWRNAFASFHEHELGRLAPGWLADLTILARDPFEDGDFASAPVLATWVGGQVHRFR